MQPKPRGHFESAAAKLSFLHIHSRDNRAGSLVGEIPIFQELLVTWRINCFPENLVPFTSFRRPVLAIFYCV
jgi:hypothetical protein